MTTASNPMDDSTTTASNSSDEDHVIVHPSNDRLSPASMFSPTALGILTPMIGFWLHDRYGEQEHDAILYMSGLALTLFSFLIIALSYVEFWRLKRKLEAAPANDPAEVEVGQDLLTGFTLPSVNANPLFQLRVRWVHPTASEYHLELYHRKLHELIRPKRRGKVNAVTREFTIEDLFGFSSITWRSAQRGDLTVLPKLTTLDPLELRRPQDGEDLYDPIGRAQGDLVELRRYEEGDPLRWLLWRVYARNRELVVRSPERALSFKQDLLAYFVSHPTDEASASTVRAYLEGGLLGEDFSLYADGCRGPAQDVTGGLAHLLASANGNPLEAFPQITSLDTRALHGCVIFASALTPLEVITHILNGLPTPPTVILSLPLDQERSRVHPRWWSKLFKVEETSALGRLTTSDLRQIVDLSNLISSRQSPPLILAQPEGRQVDPDSLERLITHSM